MSNLKRAVILGSFTAGVILLLSGRRRSATALASVGAATLASEYPEQVERMWRRAPEYLERGNQWLELIARISEKLAERGLRGGWRDIVEHA